MFIQSQELKVAYRTCPSQVNEKIVCEWTNRLSSLGTVTECEMSCYGRQNL